MNDTLEIAVFLSLNGCAGEAIAFYKQNLDAKQHMLVTYEDMAKRDPSMKLTENNKGYISHSILTIGKTKIMIAEETMNPNEVYHAGNHMSLCIQSADLQQIEQFYNRLIRDERVKVIVPLSANVFSEAYGIIEDPFGVQMQLMFDHRL